MKIISHRGLWKEKKEKNSLLSFKESMDLGYGFEIDIRSFNKELIVSHDPLEQNDLQLSEAKNSKAYFVEVLTYYKLKKSKVTLAINIKEDGLASILAPLLKEYGIINYFVFDMSIPDTISYRNEDINFFSRQSEYEKKVSLYKYSSGVWLDEFNLHWITDEILEKHLKAGKEICLVSPDLHQRDYLNEWVHYKNFEDNKLGNNKIMLCTDRVEEAENFFNVETKNDKT